MQLRRLLVPGALGLLVAGGLGLAACGGDTPDEAPVAGPAPPSPPELPVPPGERGVVREYFEVPDEGEARLEADLDLALGRVTTEPAEPGFLFQAEVELPGGRLRPRFSYERDGTTGDLALGLDGDDVSFDGVRSVAGRWRLYLSRRTPLDLTLRLGAAEADVDLTGVPLEALRLESGLARTALRFTAPNPIEMGDLEIEAGLSEFTATGLGHARFEQFDFDGGAGRFTLDFTGGALRPGAEADVRVGIASLTLVLPAGQAVELEAPTSPVVALRLPSAFIRQGDDRWLSPEAVAGGDPFRLNVESGPGRVEVRVDE